jgi:NAD(P)-dependent dehydrogenase (short-subunit alcohol dehydrogenase family)
MSAYVLTGGTEALRDALRERLRADRVLDAPDGNVTAWIHVLPDESATSPSQIVDRADHHSAECVTFVVPAWGTIAPEHAEAVEVAAAEATALMQTRLERWAAEDRRVNVVRYVPTPELVPVARDLETLAARTPMQRAATATEVADAIDFLASTAAAYVTGSVVDVDGGWSAYSWFFPARAI